MSSISGLGQNLAQYFQSPADNMRPVTAADPDGDGNDGAKDGGSDATPFGTALLLTLQKYGIDPRQFRDDFMSTLRSLAVAKLAATTGPDMTSHLNAVG